MADRKLWPWDVDIDTTVAGFARLGRALIVTGSQLTDSMVLGGGQPFGRGVSAFLRVQVPEGAEDVFRRECQPIAMKPPPRLSAGHRTPPDDGHPGRVRTARAGEVG